MVEIDPSSEEIEKECEIVITTQLEVDINPSEEDTISEEWNRLLREKEGFDMEKFGGFMDARETRFGYDFFVRRKKINLFEINAMIGSAVSSFDLVGIDKNGDDFELECREMTKIFI